MRYLFILVAACTLLLASCVPMNVDGQYHEYRARNLTGQGVAVYGAANNCTDAANVEMSLSVVAYVADGGDGSVVSFAPVMLCANGAPTNANFLGWATANGTTVVISAKAWGGTNSTTVVGGVMEGTEGARQFVM